MFSFSKIKKDFPVLGRQIEGKPITYLDSTASTLKPKKVFYGLSRYYKNFPVNIFRGVYKLSEEATFEYEKARDRVCEFINAKAREEIVFTRNATESINLVAHSYAGKHLDKSSGIVSTVMEHHANIVPWQIVCREKGANLKFLDIDASGRLDLKDLEKHITKFTKMIVFTHVSNVLGTVNPVKKIIKAAKRINPDIKVLIDGAQAVAHMKVDVRDLDCDFYVFSSHKMLGPTGLGVLWARKELLDEMVPYQTGGDMIKEVYLDRTVFNDPPNKFEAGTPHIAGALGLAEAIRYISNLGFDNIEKHEEGLIDYAFKRLLKVKGITIYGPQTGVNKGGIFAFNINSIHPHDLAQILDTDNICIRSGHHCAMPLHTRLGISSSSRASFYIYNDKNDIDKLFEGIEKAQKMLQA